MSDYCDREGRPITADELRAKPDQPRNALIAAAVLKFMEHLYGPNTEHVKDGTRPLWIRDAALLTKLISEAVDARAEAVRKMLADNTNANAALENRVAQLTEALTNMIDATGDCWQDDDQIEAARKAKEVLRNEPVTAPASYSLDYTGVGSVVAPLATETMAAADAAQGRTAEPLGELLSVDGSQRR